MPNFRPATATRNAMVNAIRDQLDGGAGPATIKIYSGTQPATGDTALSGNTLLATITLADPSLPGASSGSATLNGLPLEDTSADATGTATFARVESSTPANVFDCDVGTSGASINLNTVSIVAGGPVRITGGTLSVGAG